MHRPMCLKSNLLLKRIDLGDFNPRTLSIPPATSRPTFITFDFASSAVDQFMPQNCSRTNSLTGPTRDCFDSGRAGSSNAARLRGTRHIDVERRACQGGVKR